MKDKILFWWIFGFAAGISLYFALPIEPVIKYPILICILSLLCFWKYKNVIFLFILGFVYSFIRTDLVETKLIKHNQSNISTEGIVKDIDYTAYKDKLLVKTSDDMLIKISVSESENCKVGDNVSMKADLYAPQTRDAFNKFDYARWSFFSGTSGTGTAKSNVCLSGDSGSGLREYIHKKTNNKLVDALVLGYKNAISRSDYDKVKSAGIAHVFSISGFHFALIGGWLFFLFSCLVKLCPRFVRRFPARTLALPLTMIGLYFYLVLSGSDVATVRSFFMMFIGAIAVLIGRKVMTLRNAAIIFVLMIIIKPFWLMSAGFQLSFAAVFGLLLFFSKYNANNYGPIKKLIYPLIATTTVATVWTFPFVAYNFGNFPIYGLLGNLVMLPLFSFLIMPAVMIGTITSLFGFNLPLELSDFFYKVVIDFTGWIQTLPFSMIKMPDISGFELFIIFMGMALFIIDKKKVAIVLFLGVLIHSLFAPQPILKTTYDEEVVGFNENGQTYFNKNYSQNHPFIIPYKNKLRADCKLGICEYKTKNWTAVSVEHFLPLYKNIDKLCDYDFIISYFPIKLPKCQDKIITGSVKIYADGKIEKIRISRKWHP